MPLNRWNLGCSKGGDCHCTYGPCTILSDSLTTNEHFPTGTIHSGMLWFDTTSREAWVMISYLDDNNFLFAVVHGDGDPDDSGQYSRGWLAIYQRVDGTDNLLALNGADIVPDGTGYGLEVFLGGSPVSYLTAVITPTTFDSVGLVTYLAAGSQPYIALGDGDTIVPCTVKNPTGTWTGRIDVGFLIGSAALTGEDFVAFTNLTWRQYKGPDDDPSDPATCAYFDQVCDPFSKVYGYGGQDGTPITTGGWFQTHAGFSYLNSGGLVGAQCSTSGGRLRFQQPHPDALFDLAVSCQGQGSVAGNQLCVWLGNDIVNYRTQLTIGDSGTLKLIATSPAGDVELGSLDAPTFVNTTTEVALCKTGNVLAASYTGAGNALEVDISANPLPPFGTGTFYGGVGADTISSGTVKWISNSFKMARRYVPYRTDINNTCATCVSSCACTADPPPSSLSVDLTGWALLTGAGNGCSFCPDVSNVFVVNRINPYVFHDAPGLEFCEWMYFQPKVCNAAGASFDFMLLVYLVGVEIGSCTWAVQVMIGRLSTPGDGNPAFFPFYAVEYATPSGDTLEDINTTGPTWTLNQTFPAGDVNTFAGMCTGTNSLTITISR